MTTDRSPNRPATRVAWFHCFAGIAGDMALSSLIDAGADLDQIQQLLGRLAIRGWSLEAVPVLRCGIAATQVRIDATGDGVIRTFPAIRALIEDAGLPERVRARSLAAFSALATAEGKLHRRHPDQVHFHELAGYDTIIDIVGTASALEILEIDDVCSSAVATGTGMVRTEHGHLPNPTPAVLALLEGAPIEGRDINFELTTPTGAALLAALSSRFGPMPAMTISSTGYGAGSKELDGLPNCTQVVLGIRAPLSSNETVDAASGQPLMILEANLDDATGEQLADAISALLHKGAADAWVTPVVMKKGRPGHLVSVLCDVALAQTLRSVLVEETGSFGVRSFAVDRWAATRSSEHVDVDGHVIGVKVSPGRAKIEHDDAKRAAQAIGVPIREVISRAERAWRERTGQSTDD